MHRQAQLKIRLPEWLRRGIEKAAADADRSMNAEIVRRLSESIRGQGDWAGMAAEAILNGVDQEILTRMEEMILDAAAERAGDYYTSMHEEEQDDSETKGE
jgi:hypothetical protein